MNNVVLIGRLTKDPELRFLPNTGQGMSTFTLAVDKDLSKEKRREFEAQGKPTADFIRVVCWGRLAETSANYLVKGQLTGVQGRIQTRSWQNENGERRYATEIVANKIEFLEWKDKENDCTTNYTPDGFQLVNNDDIPF